MGNFKIHKWGEDHFYAALMTNNGQMILRGNDCNNFSACKYTIDSIRTNATDYSRYELMTSNEGKYFFRLKGSDGNEIARSEIFDTTADRYAGINLVKRSIPYAIVEGNTFGI